MHKLHRVANSLPALFSLQFRMVQFYPSFPNKVEIVQCSFSVNVFVWRVYGIDSPPSIFSLFPVAGSPQIFELSLLWQEFLCFCLLL